MSYLNICLIFVYLCCYIDDSSLGVSAGSLFKNKYKLKLISIEQCKLPPEKWDLNHRINFTCIARKINRKTAVLDIKYTVLPGTPPFIISMRGYEIQKNSAENLVFKVENITCANAVVYQVLKVAGVQITPDCVSAVGNFSASLNLDDFSFMLTSTALAGPGRYGYQFQSSNKGGILVCAYMIYDLDLNNKNNKL